MGDVAEQMINGDACIDCGKPFGDPGQGFPRACRDCKYDAKMTKGHRPSTKTACPQCQRRVKTAGLNNHLRDAHPVEN